MSNRPIQTNKSQPNTTQVCVWINESSGMFLSQTIFFLKNVLCENLILDFDIHNCPEGPMLRTVLWGKEMVSNY